MDLNVKFWFYFASLLLAVFKKGQSGYSNSPSCSNTIAYVRLHEPDLLYTHDPEVVSLCGLGSQSCCRSKVEKRFLLRSYQNVSIDIEKILQTLLQGYRSYDTLTTAYAYTIAKGKENFRDYFSSTFGIHHSKYTASADSLFQYLSNFTSNLDTSRLEGELDGLHANLFVTFSKEFTYPIRVSPDYEQCIRSEYQRFQHYTRYSTLYTSLSNILQRLRLVLRARETLQQILEHLTREQSLLSDDCSTSLMRMSTCRLCGGYSYHSLSPCKNLCLNTLGGCLAPVRRLANPLFYQYRMLDQLISQSSQEFEGFEQQLSNVAKTTMDFIFQMYNISRKIIGRVKKQCMKENDSRKRRSPTSHADWNTYPPSQWYPDSKSHSTSLSLSTGLKQFLASHYRVVSFLFNLPNKVCHTLGAAAGNSHCWNGKEKGKYKTKLFDTSITQQMNNPSVSLPPDSFLSYQFDYETMKAVSYSLQDFAKVKACYDGDLQCYASLPQCSHSDYEFGSGTSGDGDSDSEEENEVGGGDLTDSEDWVDESLSYSGDNNYGIKDRSVKNKMFYKIAKGMSHTIITCIPKQFVFPKIYTKQQILPFTEPAYFNFTTATATTNTIASAGVKTNGIVLLLGVCLGTLILLIL